MARSDIKTLLPLDEYARIMAIPAWLFNQVTHPTREQRGECYDFWLQSGWVGDPNKIVGRDEIAQAIQVAETKLAHDFLGFWPYPTWICEDEVLQPDTKLVYPYLQAHFGHIISGGIEAWELVSDNAPVSYIDTDGDGITDTASFVVTGPYLYDPLEDLPSACEIAVMPQDKLPEDNYEIKGLNIVVDADAGTITITGPKWLFVLPSVWDTTEAAPLNDDSYFLTMVDIWRHYNDPSKQVEIITDNTSEPLCTTDGCGKTIETGCISVYNHKLGIVQVQPGTYDAETGLYTRTTCTHTPNRYKLWYHAGYTEKCPDCYTWNRTLAEGIVRLANCYLPEAPCGCSYTRERWTADREVIEVTSRAVAASQAIFGTTMAGALFVFSTLKSFRLLGG